MAEMELICDRCDGLGEERWATKDMHPQSNVYGWHPGPLGPLTFMPTYYWRPCEVCAGTGFRPSGTSVPSTASASGLDLPDLG